MQWKILACLLFCVGFTYSAGPPFAVYYDAFHRDRIDLREIASRTGQKAYHLAFALGGHEGCKPMWGGEYQFNDPAIMDPIREVKSQGGEFIVATGGALGPYLEHLCLTSNDLLNAYKIVLDTVGTNHLDVDVEAPINNDLVNQALAQLQRERPNTTVSYTLMIQGEDYGLTPFLGVDVLKSAQRNGVRVDIVNAMTMEFGASSPDWGDAVIGAATSTLRQMKEIWPEKSDAELRKMLGVTPMIGRNFNGKKFELSHGRKLVNWANTQHIGMLAFWSVGRDNGGCNDIVSPSCSGVIQEEYEFTRIFQGFTG